MLRLGRLLGRLRWGSRGTSSSYKGSQYKRRECGESVSDLPSAARMALRSGGAAIGNARDQVVSFKDELGQQW